MKKAFCIRIRNSEQRIYRLCTYAQRRQTITYPTGSPLYLSHPGIQRIVYISYMASYHWSSPMSCPQTRLLRAVARRTNHSRQRGYGDSASYLGGDASYGMSAKLDPRTVDGEVYSRMSMLDGGCLGLQHSPGRQGPMHGHDDCKKPV